MVFWHGLCANSRSGQFQPHLQHTHFNYYPNGEYCREVTYGILGNGFLNGDLWKHQRRIGHAHMNNLQFHSSVAKWSREKVVNAILPLLLGTAENSDSVINLQDVFKRFTFDMTCLMILRLDPGGLSPNFSFHSMENGLMVELRKRMM